MTSLPAPAATALAPVPPLSPVEVLPAPDHNDASLTALWLHGRSPAIQRAYQANLAGARARVMTS